MKYQGKNILISQIFECISGNRGLTEAEVYKNLDKYKQKKKYEILSSSTQKETKLGFVYEGKIGDRKIETLSDTEGILIIRVSNIAGKMRYIKKGDYVVTENAYFLKLLPNKYKIDLKWFIFQYQPLAYEFANTENYGAWNKTNFFSYSFIDIPDYEEQLKIVKKFEKIEHYNEFISTLLIKINNFKDKILSQDYNSYQGKGVSIKNILDYISGNSGLTEEYIYSVLLRNGERKFKVLTGSTNLNELDKVQLCQKPKDSEKNINIFSGEGLHVVRKGKAGVVSYIKGNYTLNDDAYILYKKKDCIYDIFLKWLALVYKHTFLEYASQSDNGTWNMTGFFEYVNIDIPSIEEQKEVVNRFDTILKQEEKISNLKDKINIFLNKEFVIES